MSMEKPSVKQGVIVFPFPRARQRIVEELAIQRVTDDISEGGGVPLPPSWIREVEMMSQEIVNAVRCQAEKEGVKME